MKYHDNITFVIFTYNEEARIERVIRNFVPYGSILIVDNYSTDRTLEIAGEFHCDILLNRNPGWVEDELTVSRVKAAVKTEWIYWAFADEMVDAETIAKIGDVIRSDKYSAINIIKKNYYYGRFCYGAISARLNRVFKKNAIDFTGNKIHHFGRLMIPSDEVCTLEERYFVHHFMSYTAKSHSDSYNRYTDLEITVGYRTARLGIHIIALKAIKRFILNYFFRGGIKAGRAGLYLIVYTVWYDILREMKLYEAENDLNASAIERQHDAVRDSILATLECCGKN